MGSTSTLSDVLLSDALYETPIYTTHDMNNYLRQQQIGSGNDRTNKTIFSKEATEVYFRTVQIDLYWMIISAIVFIVVVTWAGVLNTSIDLLFVKKRYNKYESDGNDNNKKCNCGEIYNDTLSKSDELMSSVIFGFVISVMAIIVIFVLRPSRSNIRSGPDDLTLDL